MSSAAASDGSPPFRPWLPLQRLDARWLVVILITVVLVVGQYRYGILGGYPRLVAALGACVATEIVLSLLVRQKFPALQSAYTSGISLSLLTKPRADLLWPFVVGGVLAISSKYVLQYRGRHLWNPTNLAIALLLLLAPETVAILSHQWGNDLATNVAIWCFGLLIAWRAGVLHVTVAYALAFLVLTSARCALTGTPLTPEIAPLTGPMYQLFVFFMITDPRTTVSTRSGRILVAIVIAVVELGIRLAGDAQLPVLTPLYAAPPIFALAIVGPIANVIDRRRAHGTTAGAPVVGRPLSAPASQPLPQPVR